MLSINEDVEKLKLLDIVDSSINSFTGKEKEETF